MPGETPKRENLWLNLGCNVIAPTILLTWSSKLIGPKPGLLVALAFPLGYGLYDFWSRRNFNFLSALGFLGTLATGGLGLMKLEPFWFAVKDATVPGLIGLTVVVSQWTSRPLAKSLLFNDQVINVDRVDAALAERGQMEAFGGHLRSAGWLLGGSFALSAVLNFLLARHLITAAPDTPEFNAQLGRMTFWSWPVIVVPSMVITMFALWRLLNALERLSGLSLDDILHQPPPKTPAPRPPQRNGLVSVEPPAAPEPAGSGSRPPM